MMLLWDNFIFRDLNNTDGFGHIKDIQTNLTNQPWQIYMENMI